eukprot:scaffold2.g6837.t1
MSGCPVIGQKQQAPPAPSGSGPPPAASDCPVGGAAGVSPSNQMPTSANAPLPGQSKPLSTWRQHSSIPTAGAATVHSEDGVWVYPSEQMFYNAMRRKGWSPSEEDMTAVVAIHNAVNERAWREARLLNLLGYKLPFDRHDWVVDRCGKEVRYVIDFYNAAPLPDMPLAMHLDVRPALDSPAAAWERVKMQCRWMASGRWLRE